MAESQVKSALPESVPIFRHADVLLSQRAARNFAGQLGFSPVRQEEIALVASELATNVLKHAGFGLIAYRRLAERERIGMLVTSRDNGPGFNPETAVADGFSTVNSLGLGLSAINRLVDAMTFAAESGAVCGNIIACTIWLPDDRAAGMPSGCQLDIGVVSRPKPGQTFNGDAFAVSKKRDGTLLAVIDGLGHGASAHKAAALAKRYIESHYDQPFPALFQGVDRECAGGNGVVMALVRFDWASRMFTFAGIGNITGKVVGGDTDLHLPVRRGIVGRKAPLPALSEMPWRCGRCLILYSDGLHSRWRWRDFNHLHGQPAQVVAHHMYRQLRSGHDDATLIVVK